jgi:hypothetical protein
MKTGIANAHWAAVVGMVGTFLAGLILAIVHDQINLHFSGKPIGGLSQQQWLGRIATGLAFLIQKLLSAAAGIACVQVIWWTLRNRQTTVKSVNTAFNILGSPLPFIKNPKLLREAPVIIALAAISWYVLSFLSVASLLFSSLARK